MVIHKTTCRILAVSCSFLIGVFGSLQCSIKPLERSSTHLDEPPEEGAELINKIEYILRGDEESIILCRSDLERPMVDGRVFTPQQWLGTWAAYLDAKRLKIKVTQEDIDKTLAGVQREHHLSEDALRAMFKDGGYTWEEARRMLEVMQAEKIRLDLELSSKAAGCITEEEIYSYCQEHPIYEQASYTLQRAVIPFDHEISRQEQKSSIVQRIQDNTGVFAWSAAYSLEHNELPDDAGYITSLSIGGISEPREITGGFELIKLVDKKEGRYLSVDERRDECKEILREEQLKTIMDAYYVRVIEQTPIIKF